jgi:hypothetical protein
MPTQSAGDAPRPHPRRRCHSDAPRHRRDARRGSNRPLGAALRVGMAGRVRGLLDDQKAALPVFDLLQEHQQQIFRRLVPCPAFLGYRSQDRRWRRHAPIVPVSAVESSARHSRPAEPPPAERSLQESHSSSRAVRTATAIACLLVTTKASTAMRRTLLWPLLVPGNSFWPGGSHALHGSASSRAPDH